jgi:hypothetical protein
MWTGRLHPIACPLRGDRRLAPGADAACVHRKASESTAMMGAQRHHRSKKSKSDQSISGNSSQDKSKSNQEVSDDRLTDDNISAFMLA